MGYTGWISWILTLQVFKLSSITSSCLPPTDTTLYPESYFGSHKSLVWFLTYTLSPIWDLVAGWVMNCFPFLSLDNLTLWIASIYTSVKGSRTRRLCWSPLYLILGLHICSIGCMYLPQTWGKYTFFGMFIFGQSCMRHRLCVPLFPTHLCRIHGYNAFLGNCTCFHAAISFRIVLCNVKLIRKCNGRTIQ